MIKKLIFTITYVLFAISVNANHEIQKSAWEKSTRKINYKETFKEPDFPENNTEIKPRTKHRRNLSLPPLLMMLPLIVLAVILIVLIILFIKGSYESSISRKVSKEKIIEETKKFFKPEFLNRVDDIIVFHPLSKDHIISITDLLLTEIKEKIEFNGYKINFTGQCKEQLSDLGFSQEFGARPLRRVVENHVENPISLKIISGDIQKGDSLLVDVQDNEIIIVKEDK